MDNISKLSDDELRIACSLVPIKFFRDSFKQNPEKFHKVYPGQRAETISLEKVEWLALNKRNSSFIVDLLNTGIQTLLNGVQKEISKLADMGEDTHTALLRVLPKSVFCEHMDLYLKLSQDTYIPEYAELLQSAIKETEAKCQDVAATQAAITQKNAAEQIVKLQSQLKETEQRLEEEHAKETEQSVACDALQTKYQALLEMFQEKEQALAEFQQRINYADLPADVFAEEYPFVSLCRVGGITGNSIALSRITDVIDGVIQAQRKETFPERKTLFTTDRSKREKHIGIWAWRTEPNHNPLKSDYIVSKFLTSQVPVQIIELRDCETIEELKKILIQGMEFLPEGDRVLFCFVSDGKHTGLLCNTKDIIVRNGITKLNSEVIKLPLYEFSEQEIVTLDGIRLFYRINLGVPKAVVQMKDPLDVVKEAVLRRMSIAKLKPWITIREAQGLRTFFEEMPTTDFYQEIADICVCSIEDAKGYADDFIQKAGAYLREEDVEREILEMAIKHSPSLLEKCRILNQKLWEEEHSEQLKQAKTKLEQISEEARQQQHLHDQLLAQKEQLIEQQEELKAKIAQQEKLAADVEDQISDRIAVARKNAADFISEMAFVQPGKTESAFPAEQNLFSPGEKLSSEISVLHEVQDAIYQIRDELEEAGVSQDRSHEFAAFLYAAYTSRTPLLLAGPNGLDIADAVSSALFGQTSSVLHCESSYNSSIIKQCVNDESPIMAVLSPLHPKWIDHIHELFADVGGKFIIAIHPFAEDLLIEPRGLYNYMLPVLTELFVEQKATRNFVGGGFHTDFQDYDRAEPQRIIPLEAKLAMPPLVKNRLCQILSDMKVLLEDKTSDGDFLFGTIPYAYATGRVEVIREKIQNNPAVFKKSETKTLLLSFLGESE